MRPSKFQKAMTSYADKWGATSMTISNLAKKGCDFDAPDEDVAKWLLSHCRRKSQAMKDAIAGVLKPTTIKETRQMNSAALKKCETTMQSNSTKQPVQALTIMRQ